MTQWFIWKMLTQWSQPAELGSTVELGATTGPLGPGAPALS